MRNKKFTNKETYLAYRSEWKAEYKKLSQKIREFKDDVRGRNITWEEALKLYKLKRKATDMLEELKEAKVESQRQCLASKQMVEA